MSRKNILKLLEHQMMAQWHLDQVQELALVLRDETPSGDDVTVYHQDVQAIMKRMKEKAA